MKKVKKHYYYNKDVIEHANNNPLITSFSEWVCEKYYEEFMTIDGLTKKINFLTMQLDIAREKTKQTVSIVTKKELLWISEVGIDAIKRTTLNGVYKRFAHKFNSVITKRQFMLTLSQLGFKGDNK